MARHPAIGRIISFILKVLAGRARARHPATYMDFLSITLLIDLRDGHRLPDGAVLFRIHIDSYSRYDLSVIFAIQRRTLQKYFREIPKSV